MQTPEDHTIYELLPNGQKKAVTCEHGVYLDGFCRQCCSNED